MPGIAIGNCIPFNRGGVSWSSYWTTRTPSALTVLALTATSVKVDWVNAGTEDYDGHLLERSTDGVTYAEIDTIAVGTNTYTDTVDADTVYYYRVRAYKGTNYSEYAEAAVLEYGPEMNIDVNFNDPTKWHVSAGAQVSGGKGTINVTSGGLQYIATSGITNITLLSGETYRIVLSTTLVSGTGELAFCSGAGNNIRGVSNHWSTNIDVEITPGENASSFGVKRYTISGNYVFEIDNFSVKKKFD